MSRGSALASRAKVELVTDAKIKFIWPCGTFRTTDYAKLKPGRGFGASGAKIMVRMWQKSGVIADCPKHFPAKCPEVKP